MARSHEPRRRTALLGAAVGVWLALAALTPPAAACPLSCGAGLRNKISFPICKCVACESGRFSVGNNKKTTCTVWGNCPASTFVSTQPSAVNDRRCTTCSNSFTTSTNQNRCQPWRTCPAGQFVRTLPSPLSDRSCSSCASGTFTTSANQLGCLPHTTCFAGQFISTKGTSTRQQICKACASGTFSTSNNARSCSSWRSCPVGTFISSQGFPFADRRCSTCGSGTFADSTNQNTCLRHATCQPGTFVSTAPTAAQNRKCSSCAAGMFTDGVNQGSCAAWKTCAAGNFVSTAPSAKNDRTCSPCASGTFSASANLGSCTALTDCAPGMVVSMAASATNDRQCKACGINKFSETANQATCTVQPDCPAGQLVSRLPSASQRRLCSNCAPGTFNTVTNANQCSSWTVCAPGFEQDAAPTATSDRTCRRSRCAASLASTVNAIATSAACLANQFEDSCTVSCPPGYTGETTTFTCSIAAPAPGAPPVDWDGRFPVCYRFAPKLVATANSQYVGAAVEHNGASMLGGIAASSDPVIRGFALTATGQLQGFFPASEEGTHSVTVDFTFPGSTTTLTSTFVITVNPPLKASETTITIAQNEFFEGITPGIVGGSPPFVFTLEEGTLPRGLRVSAANGQVLGIPEVQGSFNATVAVTDSTGAKLALQPFRLFVTEGLTINWNRTEPIPVGVQGEQFALAPPPNVTSNAQGELSYSAGGELPPGLSVDPRTGTLFGVPVAPRATPYNLTIRASDDTNILVVVERIAFAVRRPFDCDSPGNGPNGLGCGAGECLDAVPFDESFACNCSGVPFEGDNCEVPIVQAAQQAAASGLSTTVIGAVAGMGSLVLMLAVLFLLARRRAQRLANKPFDFEDELERMQEEGLLRTSRVPREIPRRKIKTLDKLGAGQFGDVFKGTVNESDTTGVPEYLAAIKTLKEDPSGFEKTELMREAATMAQFSHENVVNLIGVCTSGMPYLLVVQFCEHGALNSHLKHIKQDNDALDFRSIMQIAHDIAKGMEYLNGMGLVHRDLAARNVLLDSHYTCKVADFGLSRDLDAGEYYRSAERGMIPIRWTAPEAIEDRKFSSQSDVWAYAVTLHEVFTYAELPYNGMSNQAVWLQVQNGYRLPREPNCPVEFYEGVMLPSWAAEPADRPLFPAVLEFLETEYKMLGEGTSTPQLNMKRRHQTSMSKSADMTGADLPAAGTAGSTEAVDLMPEDATGYVDFTEADFKDDDAGTTSLDMESLKGLASKPASSMALPEVRRNPYVMDASQPRYSIADDYDSSLTAPLAETTLDGHLYEEPVTLNPDRAQSPDEYLNVEAAGAAQEPYNPADSLGGAQAGRSRTSPVVIEVDDDGPDYDRFAFVDEAAAGQQPGSPPDSFGFGFPGSSGAA